MDPYKTKETETVLADHVKLGKHSTELFADAGIDFIRNYDDENPFFLYMSFMAPHDPRSMPEEFLNMYDIKNISLPENYKTSHSFEYGIKNLRDEVLAPYPRTPEIVKEHIRDYYAMITHLDYEIGRVIDVLIEKDLYEETIIILAGDNGLALGQHGLFGKQNCYEHSIRVPLIFSGGTIPKNKRNQELVYLLDIFPTLCGLTGIKPPATVEGIDLSPLINNHREKGRESLYFAYTDMIRAVKKDHMKLIEYIDSRDISDIKRYSQLFDLNSDPCEMCDLSQNQDFREIRDSLYKEMFRLRDLWDDRSHPLGERFWKMFNLPD
jgi:arylsulfatase A-like enzyme